jgi:hypothetical protein
MALPRKTALLAALAGACAIAVAGPAADASSPAGCGGSGGVGPKSGCSSNKYVNPFHSRRWDPARIDMGVDYIPKRRTAMRAIGDAKILVSDSHSGWPGGHYMVYKLLDGDHAGYRIFVAETLKHMTPKGHRVQAGDRIATALTGGTGIEIGWADRSNQPRAARCYYEGEKTNSGKEMARFLRSLGAPLYDKPKPGPDYPTGKRC